MARSLCIGPTRVRTCGLDTTRNICVVMSDGRKLVTQQASILAYALRIFRRDAERNYPGPSVAVRDPHGGARDADAIPEQRRVDAAVAAYVEWRVTCTDVRSACRRWARAPAAEADLAYAVYRAALDREQAAAEVYAGLMKQVGHLVECGLEYPLSASTPWAPETR